MKLPQKQIHCFNNIIAHIKLPKQPYLIQEEHYSSSHETHCVPRKNNTYQFTIIMNCIYKLYLENSNQIEQN